MSELSAAAVLRRFLVLTVLRWLPVGLLIPVMVLLPLQRGLSLSQVGLAAAIQGFVVFALELPTGGLADSVGRRRVLLGSGVVATASLAVFVVADSFSLLVTTFVLQGVHRALDSGPLEAWYVDTALAADPGARIDRGMSAYGTGVGLSVASGALLGGGLVALDSLPEISALVTPVAVALVLQVASLVGVALLMAEPRPTGATPGLGRSVLATPQTIATGLGLLRSSPVLCALIAVELFWGFGMVCFESLMPVRLAEVVGGTDPAAAIAGPAASGAWLVFAAGSAITAWLGQGLGVAPAAALMRLLHGVAVAGLGLFAGLAGVLVAYLACYAIHGASNAAHMTLLHRQATATVRATVVSLNSMVSQPAGAVGLIVLTALAEATSISTAMYVGAVVLAAAAPLYIPAWRAHNTNQPVPAAKTAASIEDLST